MPWPSASDIADRYEVGLNNAQIESLVAEFAEIAERYRGAALDPREVTEAHTAPTGWFHVRRWPLASIEDLEADGDPVDVETVTFDKYGRVDLPAGAESVTITYKHGVETPALARRACVEYVRSVAQTERSGVSRDIIRQSFDGGFTQYSTPDWERGRPTGFLEVDRLLNSLPDYRLFGIG